MKYVGVWTLGVFIGAAVGLFTCASQLPKPQGLLHRPEWMIDPQGHEKNHGPGDCEKGQVPYYLYDDNETPYFLECMRGTS